MKRSLLIASLSVLLVAYLLISGRYEKLSDKDAMRIWTNFKTVKLGVDKEISLQQRVLKFVVTEENQKDLGFFVSCSGSCEDFTCANPGEPFRLGCIPSEKCIRREFLLKAFSSFKSDSEKWLKSITYGDRSFLLTQGLTLRKSD